MKKVTFLGDIMCEPIMLKTAKTREGTFDFDGVFCNIKGMLNESDFVIGNLETPLAGEGSGFVNELFSFNAPDEFAQAIKNAGIDFLSTANNHCMDRGLDGLKRTVRKLEEIGVSHDGTYDDSSAEHNAFLVDIGDTRIAIVPFTYGTNYALHHRALPDTGFVNLLHSDTAPVYINSKKGILSSFKSFLLSPLKREQIILIKKILKMTYNKARKDDYLNQAETKPYFDKLKKIIRTAKDNSDIVFFYPHVGGQFNITPGIFTEYTVAQSIDFGADAIVASHPHIVQKAVIDRGVPCFYSIGNFSMSPNSVYLLHEHLPEYGLAVHFYIESKKILRISFSILKIIESGEKILTVYPVDLYKEVIKNNKQALIQLEKDIIQIYNTVTGKIISDHSIIKKEYDFFDMRGMQI